jgi:hypothetical protein
MMNNNYNNVKMNLVSKMAKQKKKKAQTQPDNFTAYLNQTGHLPGGNTMGAERVYGGIRL